MFLRTLKTAADSDRSEWGGFFFNPAPIRGQHITADGALQLTAVYSCVRVLTDSIASLPFQMYRVGADGGKTMIKNHWLYRLFAKRPNDYMNPFEFMELLVGHLALRGNAFCLIVSNARGEVTDLHPIHPDNVRIEMLSGVNWRYRVKNLDGTESIYPRADIFHIKGLSPNGVMGYNPIELARKMLATGIAAQDYGIRYFENDASPSGGWIEHPTNFRDKEARDNFRAAWQAQQGGSNKGKVAILEYGLKFHDGVSVKNSDAQFIETQQKTKSDIAGLFRIPPHMIGDLTRSTNNNIEHQGIEFVVNCLTPWIVRIEEAIKYTFLDVEDDELCVNYPTISLLRGDSVARSAYINTGIMNGTLTRNEARLMEDRNPLPGLDEPLRMLSMVTESDAKETQDDTESQELPNVIDATDDAEEQATDARMVALASAVADRVARKEVETVSRAFKNDTLTEAYAKHADFVAAALGVSAESATRYCREQMACINAKTSTDELYEIARAKLARLALQG